MAPIVTALRPSAQRNGCAARKLKEVGRFVAAVWKASAAQATTPDLPALTAAVAAARTLFLARIRRVELAISGGCLTVGDADHLADLALYGPTAQPTSPAFGGAVHLIAQVCPTCGDAVLSGSEECDAADAGACSTPCTADCRCAVCGDGAINLPAEVCDGADDAPCHGLCQNDCTCPAPVCGNGVPEVGEECDGATCDIGGVGVLGCRAGPGAGGCTCCGGNVCGLVGCCYSEDLCLSYHQGFGSCLPIHCSATHACAAGYTCIEIPGLPNSGYCAGDTGAGCADPIRGQYVPCLHGNCVGGVCP